MPKPVKSVPSEIQMIEASEDCRVDIEAATEEGKPKPFKMLAYTGGVMYLTGFYLPVVVDLSGMKVTAKSRPALRNHDPLKIVGHTSQIENNGRNLRVAGLISGSNEYSREVEDSSKNGFPWQSSIGARILRISRIAEGETVEANGRKFVGPLLVARQSILKEVSFVPLGADDSTNAKVAAQSAGNYLEIEDMNFEEWLKANFEDMEFSDTQLKILKAQFESEAETEEGEGKQTATKTKLNASAGTKPGDLAAATGAVGGDGSNLDPVVNMRASMADEFERTNEIKAACEDHPKIAAQAIREGWDINKTKVAVMNAEMPAAPEQPKSGAPNQGKVIEAALCLHCSMTEDETGKYYDEKVMNAAIEARRRISLHYLIYETIRAAGGNPTFGAMDDHTIKAALRADQQLQASGGFSTISLSGTLGNVANKQLLAAYASVPMVVFEFCAIASHNDFKAHTKYRLVSSGQFRKVGPTGELKHGSLSEDTYSNEVDTEGMILTLTRQAMVNDDLGALMNIAKIIGREAALALNDAVFTLLLANANNFCHADNNNYIEGADTALSIEGLTKGEQVFLDQTDSKGKPVLIQPAVLLTPTSLKVTGEDLYKQTSVNETTTANKGKPNNNSHAGKFKPVSAPYLNNAAYTGSSPTAWYLFANPNDVAAFEIAFLRGMRNPTIESGDTNFNTLGMSWRGFHDFGVAQQDPSGVMKSKGAA
ncbi:hypothetical protein [Gimesia chilikensis]|uniref:phage major capsid protein n=1 Tax=Gimesia chilikensis TaxID=2605989 RepID=UPI003A9442A8